MNPVVKAKRPEHRYGCHWCVLPSHLATRIQHLSLGQGFEPATHLVTKLPKAEECQGHCSASRIKPSQAPVKWGNLTRSVQAHHLVEEEGFASAHCPGH